MATPTNRYDTTSNRNNNILPLDTVLTNSHMKLMGSARDAMIQIHYLISTSSTAPIVMRVMFMIPTPIVVRNCIRLSTYKKCITI